MVLGNNSNEKDRSIRIPPKLLKQIKQVMERRDDFKSVAEYVRHCIREQLKRDAGDSR